MTAPLSFGFSTDHDIAGLPRFASALVGVRLVLLRAATLVAFLFAVGFALTLGYFVLVGKPIAVTEAQSVEYKDFITILLTALAVMMAVATVLVAALAIWGFSALREEASRIASKEANTVADKVAREVAEAVAARTVRERLPVETTEREAQEIAEAWEAPAELEIRSEGRRNEG